MKTMIIQILFGFLGSFAFAFLYNIRGKKLMFAGGKSAGGRLLCFVG